MTSTGIDVDAVGAWLLANAPGAAPPLGFHLLAGGNSNLTYRVEAAGRRRFVLRRPPLHGVLATANDMGREWRAIRALQGSAVPVPRAIAFCADPSVTGAPFYVAEFVDGFVHRSFDDTVARTTPVQRACTSRSLVDVLADLHAVDIDAVGLGDHGRRSRYLERQIRRWYGQYRATATEDVPDVDATYHRLLERLPADGDVTVVHGDYRLGNCIVHRDGSVAAVVDWEISTLGDPLADLAYLLVTWARPGTAAGELEGDGAPTMAEGFASAEELLRRYEARSGRDVSGIGYYLAFNHWRYACIVQGVVARHGSAALGDPSEADLGRFAAAVRRRAAQAAAALDEHLTGTSLPAIG